MSNLAGVTNRDLRGALGTRSLNAAGLAIHGGNAENILTTAAVVHVINGVFQTALAIDAELDLSTTAVISANDATVLSSVVTMAALAAGDDSVTKVYILACKGNVSYIVEPSIDTAADDDFDFPLRVPKGYAPYGLIKIVQSTTSAVGSALFKLGTTDMSGITNQTVTFFDIAVVPATVADIVEV